MVLSQAPVSSSQTKIRKFNLMHFLVEWCQGNTILQLLNQADRERMLENCLHRVMMIDLATQPELSSSPYVRFIFDNYFVNYDSQNQVSHILQCIEALKLDHEEASQLKLLLLLQSGKVSTASTNSHQCFVLPIQIVCIYRDQV